MLDADRNGCNQLRILVPLQCILHFFPDPRLYSEHEKSFSVIIACGQSACRGDSRKKAGEGVKESFEGHYDVCVVSGFHW